MTTKTADKVEKWTLELGKVEYRTPGKRVNPVTVEVELRHKVNTVAPYLDVDLKECREYVELSITGNVWNPARIDIVSGGQNIDAIRKLLGSDSCVARLCDIWARWHLNGMNAGTREQNAFLADVRVEAKYPKTYYDEACKALEKANLLEVRTGQKVGTSIGTMVDKMYKYGSAWLVERMPDEVVAEVRTLCEAIASGVKPEETPKDFASRHGITAKVDRAESNPNALDWQPDAKHYLVTLTRGKEEVGWKTIDRQMAVPFSTGAKGDEPTAIDVLGCLASDSRGVEQSFENWCDDLRLDSDSRRHEKTYNACKRQAGILRSFLGDDLFKELLEETE